MTDDTRAHEPTRKCWCGPDIVELAAGGRLDTGFHNATPHPLVFVNHTDGTQTLVIKEKAK